jgi:hypothetical protein
LLDVCAIFDSILDHYSLYNDSEDENNTLLTQSCPPDEFIEPDIALDPQFHCWVCTTKKVVNDLVSDPFFQHQTCSQFQ